MVVEGRETWPGMMSLMLRERTHNLNVIIVELKLVKKIERVKTHLSKFSKKIKLDKQAKKASTSQNQASNAAATLVVDDKSSDSDNPPIEQSKSKGLGKFLTKTTVKEEQKLDMQIASCQVFFSKQQKIKSG